MCMYIYIYIYMCIYIYIAPRAQRAPLPGAFKRKTLTFNTVGAAPTARGMYFSGYPWVRSFSISKLVVRRRSRIGVCRVVTK